MKKKFWSTVQFLGIVCVLALAAWWVLTSAAAELSRQTWHRPWSPSPTTGTTPAGVSGPLQTAAELAVSTAATDNAKMVEAATVVQATFNPALEDFKVAGIQIGGLADGQYNIEFLGDVPPALEVCGSLQGLEWHPAVATTYPRGYPVYEGGDLVLMGWKPGEKRLDKKFVINFRVSPPRDRLVSQLRKRLRPGRILDFQPPHDVQAGSDTMPLLTDVHIGFCYEGGTPIPPEDFRKGYLALALGDGIKASKRRKPYLAVKELQTPHLVLGNNFAESIDVYITVVVYPR